MNKESMKGKSIEVDAGLIDFIDLQPRSENEYEDSHPDMKKLIASIRQNGLLMPPMAIPNRKSSGRYLVVAGRRRATACMRYLGWTSIPVIFREDLTLEQAMRVAVEENMVRKDAHPVDNMLYLYRASSRFGSEAVESIQSLGQRTARKYIKIGKIISHLSDADRDRLKTLAVNVSSLDPLESIHASQDPRIMMERVMSVMDAKKKGKGSAVNEHVFAGNNIEAVIKIGPRITTIRVKTGADVAEHLLPVIHSFVQNPVSDSPSPSVLSLRTRLKLLFTGKV